MPQRAPASSDLAQGVAAQPLVAHARRLLEATEQLGVPFSAADRGALDRAFQETDDAKATEGIQHVLDAKCLVNVHINPEIVDILLAQSSTGIFGRENGL